MTTNECFSVDSQTCVSPDGRFIYGIHRPFFRAANLREHEYISALGKFEDGRPFKNHDNFPDGDVIENAADWVFEIRNPFPFRGAAFITKNRADATAEHPENIGLPPKPPVSYVQSLRKASDIRLSEECITSRFETLPEALKLSLASTSTDPEDLARLADMACDFIRNESGEPTGLYYREGSHGKISPRIRDHKLFEVVANNRALPDTYKQVMVLKPGVQGRNEIIGEWRHDAEQSHIFEYLRRNSYIPWGHYAANMAHDAIRYRIEDLSLNDMIGLRRLYYQRIYVNTAIDSGVALPSEKRSLSSDELETLRLKIVDTVHSGKTTVRNFNCSLWGWNYGFGYAGSGYRLHGSHQQIHQQFAMIPSKVRTSGKGETPAFACGDLIAYFIRNYRAATGRPFFETYIKAIRNNTRMDGRTDRPAGLIIHEDDQTMLFVPKAQTSQWEIQIMTKPPIGHVLEADSDSRSSIDRSLLLGARMLSALGAEMVTCIEYSKRFDSEDTDQRLIYALLPKLPQSPGSFTEAQLRWINGHYPEDFAAACRQKVDLSI